MSKKYDVAVCGLWYGKNYGSIATYYALNQVISSMGKSVLMIDKPIISNNDHELKMNHSRRFANEHYNISEQYKIDDFYKLNDLCDAFVLGSDQVWNYGISKNFRKLFYFDFVREEKKKIVYAASFGHGIDFAPDDERKKISSYMEKIDGISVREKDGVRICKDIYGIKAKQVLDPVFLANPSIYKKLIEKSSANETEPFLATYILDPTPEKREAILYLSKKLGNIKIINMLDGLPNLFEKNKNAMNLSNCIENLQVEDWLYYLSNAKFVLTDSCHGASFALIFKKNFIAITNKARGYSRFKSISELFHFEDHLVTDPKVILKNNHLLSPIDYKTVDYIMEKQQKESYRWLEEKLNSPKKSTQEIIKQNKVSVIDKAIVRNLDMNLCMGCGACVSKCPVNALELSANELGYYKSSINSEKCINCGVCSSVCPALKLPEKSNNKSPKLYEFIANDENILFNSSSGGAFSLLVKETFKKNGVIFGASWNDDLSVSHIMIDNEKDLYKLQKSKYLQSYMGDTFRKVKENLEKDRFVLFSGCPCQVSGLKSYLGKDYDNLILIDLLCSYAPSQMFFKKYIEDDFSEKTVKYEFRNKKSGWNCSTIKAEFSDNSSTLKSGGKQDNYQRVYHNHIMCSPHCENCEYQSLPRYGDITIGDFWGIEKKDKSIDCSKGVSAVLCNNEKGKKFFEGIPESSCRIRKEVPLEWLGGNGYAVRGHNFCSPYRNDFYTAIKTMPFSKAINYAVKPNHGNYPSPEEFLYSAENSHFKFSPMDWEEKYVNGVTMLFAKEMYSKPKKYASLALPYPLKKNKKYTFKVRFKISTESNLFSFHLKSAGEQYVQIIYSHKTSETDSIKWIEVSKEFVPDFNCYDEIMVGASQVTGDNRWLAIDYIKII